MNIVEQLKQDYARFPDHQTYGLYAKDVHFKDPLNDFNGVGRYRKMVGFIGWFFGNVQMDLHQIEQISPTLITMQWTLNLTAPLPWSPRLAISGHTELGLNQAGLINSHVDYWERSRLEILKQVLGQS